MLGEFIKIKKCDVIASRGASKVTAQQTKINYSNTERVQMKFQLPMRSFFQENNSVTRTMNLTFNFPVIKMAAEHAITKKIPLTSFFIGPRLLFLCGLLSILPPRLGKFFFARIFGPALPPCCCKFGFGFWLKFFGPFGPCGVWTSVLGATGPLEASGFTSILYCEHLLIL